MPKVKDFREKVQPAAPKAPRPPKAKRRAMSHEDEDLNLKADIAETQMDLGESEVSSEFEENESLRSLSSERRRPGLEERHENQSTSKGSKKIEVSMMDSPKSQGESMQSDDSSPSSSFDEQSSSSHSEEKTKVELNFYGKEWLQAKAPRAVRSLEIIAEDWVNDGRFEGLPLGHPLMQMLASKSLQKAKEVEKKLEEKGVFFLARTGVELVKSKVEGLRKKD